jgi:hypothetical protein
MLQVVLPPSLLPLVFHRLLLLLPKIHIAARNASPAAGETASITSTFNISSATAAAFNSDCFWYLNRSIKKG